VADLTRVVNLRTEPYDVYIGRRGRFANPLKEGGDGYFGNPHMLRNGHYHHRLVVIELFRRYFYARLQNDAEFKTRVEKLRGLRLGCFCKPLPCHGDVIADYLNKS